MPSEYEVPDQMKNDFQNAKKRNLHTWTQWRMKLNNSLVDAVRTSSEVQDIESFQRFMNHEVPDPAHPTTNPKTLMTYSAAENSSTNLRRTNFYTYGIPRVKLSPVKMGTISRNGLENQDDYSSSRNFGLYAPQAPPEEVALDYFGYEEPKERGTLARQRGPTPQYSGQYTVGERRDYSVPRNHGQHMNRLIRFPIVC